MRGEIIMDIDLDILNERKITIKLFGEMKELRDLTMDENFKSVGLRQEVNNANSQQDMKKHAKARRQLLKLLITPITDDEVDRITHRQFEKLLEQIDFIDLRDQGVVNSMEEYRKMKSDTAKEAMKRSADQLFQAPQ